MAKPEWGAKHQCAYCSKIFYDMKRDPKVCPGCGKTHVPVKILKPGRAPAKAASKVSIVMKPVVKEEKPATGGLLDDDAILKEDETDNPDDDDNVDGENLGVVVSSKDSEGQS